MKTPRDLIQETKRLHKESDCPCIGLCYVEAHWEKNNYFRSYAANNITKLAEMLEASLDTIERAKNESSWPLVKALLRLNEEKLSEIMGAE